ncbi:porin [Paraburkholderia sp. Tr-20389]|uniref:porin n=1 Tax=Paraburkholderia sp. Tr-20389 TaxID=2703903 RepID=UPI0019819650|nr:porin [Paraburkholderia sp. Tr-20389]MBN3753722.1 porin [Paraburkholderia sp. Tr-20389]
MKKVVKTGIALTVTCLAYQAHAQNTVTLYGVVDTGLMYIHNSGGHSTQVLMTSGSESGSRFGLKGSEDLGGGLRAIFQIENGFNSTNGKLGQGSRMFGRQAYVGLTGNGWGTVTLGRQYDPVVDLVQPIQGDNWLGGFFTSPGDIDNADNSVRFNNAVKWASPNWSGLQLEAMYSFGGVAGSVGSGQTYSGAASYSNGALSLAAGYLHIDNGNTSLSTRGTTSADSLFNSSVNNAYASSRSINIARAGGNYVLGSVTLGGYYSFSQYNPDASSTFTKAEKYHNGEVYAVWQITPALLTQAGYDYLKSSGDSSAKQNQFSIGVDYFLSKRTDVYGVAAYALASGQNGAGAAQAVIGSNDVDSGSNKQALITVGLRHKF